MRRLILSSSQSKHPLGTDPWVQATVAAVDESAREGHEIVASTGLSSWELALWRAASVGAHIHLVVPGSSRIDRDGLKQEVLDSFSLGARQVTWHWACVKTPGRKDAWPLRDRMALALAQEVVEVSVRPCGRLATLLQKCGRVRIATHAVPFDRRPRGQQWERRLPTKPEPIWANGALVHLTRSCDGPWPGEKRWRYYRDVVASEIAYARSGFQTLCRILREQRIRGSTFRSKGGQRRVSLTSCSTPETLELIRYRTRYARYAFEPYGLAFSKEATQKLGARPVSYDTRSMVPGRRAGPGDHWRREKEWRIPGDVDIEHVSPHDVTVLVATRSEARALASWSPYPVRCFGYAEGDEDERIASSRASHLHPMASYGP